MAQAHELLRVQKYGCSVSGHWGQEGLLMRGPSRVVSILLPQHPALLLLQINQSCCQLASKRSRQASVSTHRHWLEPRGDRFSCAKNLKTRPSTKPGAWGLSLVCPLNFLVSEMPVLLFVIAGSNTKKAHHIFHSYPSLLKSHLNMFIFLLPAASPGIANFLLLSEAFESSDAQNLSGYSGMDQLLIHSLIAKGSIIHPSPCPRSSLSPKMKVKVLEKIISVMQKNHHSVRQHVNL